MSGESNQFNSIAKPGADWWVPMRSRHTNQVWVEGPYDRKTSYRERDSALAQLEGDAEICVPFLAESKSLAIGEARKRLLSRDS